MQTLFWGILNISAKYVIKINQCNFELYRFKVCAFFFETQ